MVNISININKKRTITFYLKSLKLKQIKTYDIRNPALVSCETFETPIERAMLSVVYRKWRHAQ